MSYKKISLFFFFSFKIFSHEEKRALIIVPVADLVGEAKSSTVYKNLPLCTHPVTECPRMHQLLYNEIVHIEQETHDQVCISISSLFFTTEHTEQPQTLYWTLKKNLLPFTIVKKNAIDCTHFPQPLNFLNHQSVNLTDHIVTLVSPWHDPITQRTYSAGTRFVMNTTLPLKKNHLPVFALTKNFHEVTLWVPLKHIFTTKHNEDKRNAFIRILRLWIDTTDDCIPYVWGGSSYLHRTSRNHFTRTTKNGQITFVPCATSKGPLSGFDCAGLISRAAQIAGIPFFYKNTKTIAFYLHKITRYEDLATGDLIWFPGHIMIISDINKGLCIEARGYSHGYGKVHELPLNKIFKNVSTYKQLFHEASTRKCIYRLNSKSEPTHTIESLALLKLPC